MTQDTKMIIGIGAATAAIFALIVFAATRSGSPSAGTAAIDQSRLVREDSYKVAAENSKVTMVEFADFQCEACRAAFPGVKLLLEEYKDRMTFVLRYFPLPGHQHSRIAAESVEAAGEQGKFWEMEEMLFAKQDEWGSDQTPVSADKAKEYFIGYAQALGLNVDQFKQALESKKFASKVARDFADAEALGLEGTPSFFINGQKINESPSYANLKKRIESELAKFNSQQTVTGTVTPRQETVSSSQNGTSDAFTTTSTAIQVKSYTLVEVAAHASAADCWMAIEGKVYDVTDFVGKHPGGPAIVNGCGKDATVLFNERPTNNKGPHPSQAKALLQKYEIGLLTP